MQSRMASRSSSCCRGALSDGCMEGSFQILVVTLKGARTAPARAQRSCSDTSQSVCQIPAAQKIVFLSASLLQPSLAQTRVLGQDTRPSPIRVRGGDESRELYRAVRTYKCTISLSPTAQWHACHPD